MSENSGPKGPNKVVRNSLQEIACVGVESMRRVWWEARFFFCNSDSQDHQANMYSDGEAAESMRMEKAAGGNAFFVFLTSRRSAFKMKLKPTAELK